jgi:DNA-binding NtrC family response regulator
MTSERTVRIEIPSSLIEGERLFILATLEHFGNRKGKAAEYLGLNIKTLQRKLQMYAKSESEPRQSTGRSGYFVEIKVPSPLLTLERVMVERTLEYAHENRSQAAGFLALSTKTLRRKLKPIPGARPENRELQNPSAHR